MQLVNAKKLISILYTLKSVNLKIESYMKYL